MAVKVLKVKSFHQLVSLCTPYPSGLPSLFPQSKPWPHVSCQTQTRPPNLSALKLVTGLNFRASRHLHFLIQSLSLKQLLPSATFHHHTGLFRPPFILLSHTHLHSSARPWPRQLFLSSPTQYTPCC